MTDQSDGLIELSASPPEPKYELCLWDDGWLKLAFCYTTRPNRWWRFWQRILLGWRWCDLEKEKMMKWSDDHDDDGQAAPVPYRLSPPRQKAKAGCWPVVLLALLILALLGRSLVNPCKSCKKKDCDNKWKCPDWYAWFHGGAWL